MRVPKTTNINNKTFTGFYNNKIMVKGAELAGKNGAFFAAGTTLVLASFVRPVAILATPNVENENKQYAFAKSISSSFVNLGLIGLVSIPVLHGVKNIEKNPQKFLNKKTLKFFEGETKKLNSSRY